MSRRWRSDGSIDPQNIRPYLPFVPVHRPGRAAMGMESEACATNVVSGRLDLGGE